MVNLHSCKNQFTVLVICTAVFCLFFVLMFINNPNSPFVRSLNFRQEYSSSIQTDESKFPCTISFKLGKCPCTRTIRPEVPEICLNASAETQTLLQAIKNRFGSSTCADWATLRGPKQRVISYSVYGRFPSAYYNGLTLLLPRITEVFPGWVTRLYHNGNENNQNITKWMCDMVCKHPHLDVCDVKNLPVFGDITKSSGRVWRFSPLGDALVDKFLVRDLDSPILDREVAAVKEWLDDGTCFHVMRDHPFHGVTMLAGTWGGCNNWRPNEVFRVSKEMLRSATYVSADQPVMWRWLWPIASKNITAHDAYSCLRFRNSKPFPKQRDNFTYVGEKSLMYRYEYPKSFQECPVSCRPKAHKDWKYC